MRGLAARMDPREKVCVRCESPFRDESQSNRRRYCSDSCQTLEKSERGARYRARHRDHYRRLNAGNQRRKKAERLKAIDEIKSSPCVDCRKSFPPYVMDFDHRDPSRKQGEINHLLHKLNAPWSRILKEIAKCDVVCVNCHRMRTWQPPKKALDYRRKLIIELKSVPCADCRGRFHYSQLDFDHVRGEKIREVPLIKNKAGILSEAAKCEIVCANCHRERSQKKKRGQQRVEVPKSEMLWQRQSAGTPRTLVASKRPRTAPQHRPWHDLAGTMLDKEVAAVAGISTASVSMFREKVGISRYQKPRNWHALAGTRTDSEVAGLANVHPTTVRAYREKKGIPIFRSKSNEGSELNDA